MEVIIAEAEALPNISGRLITILCLNMGSELTSPFVPETEGSPYKWDAGNYGSNGNQIYFNANRNCKTYKNGATVKPNTIALRYWARIQ